MSRLKTREAIVIPGVTWDDLLLMVGMEASSKHDSCPDALLKRYNGLRTRLIAALLPLVEMMAEAKLLTIFVNGDGDNADIRQIVDPKYLCAEFEVGDVGLNGGIVLEAGECQGWALAAGNRPEDIAARVQEQDLLDCLVTEEGELICHD